MSPQKPLARVSAQRCVIFFGGANMKKAKRLLAVLLAAIMMFSAAVVPGYAYNATSENYRNPNETKGKYWFTYEQGCAYLLDSLDAMLGEANMTMTCDELNDMVNIGVNIFTSNAFLNLDDYLEDAGNEKGLLDFRSVDGLIRTLYGVIDCLYNSPTTKFLSPLLGDFLDEDKSLNDDPLDPNATRDNTDDRIVFEMIINWVCNQKVFLRSAIAGTFKWGSILPMLLDGILDDMVPGASVEDLHYFLRVLLYQMLINSEAESIPDGQDLDTALQQLVNWLLIDGTGTTAESGALSMLGENAEPLMPGMADQPGAASIYGIAIQADRNGDGSLEDCTMGTYQFVNNLIQALLDGMLAPMLEELLIDALDAQATPEYPLGDPAVMSDVMFNTIIGAVEGLMVQNGAPEITYTEEENTYPIPKIQKLVDWFLMPGGGLETLIKIDYTGFHIQDNFMSLLNDVARLGINLLPGLGLFADSSSLAYTADELNEVWYYNDAKEIVAADDESAVDQLYVTYETEELVYAASKSTSADGATVIDSYNYLSTGLPVNTTDESAASYMNPHLIRPDYVITVDMVYACLIKMALNDMIDGCYFPEWTTDIATVLAYGFAGLAVPIIPENNYYARLDAYHEQVVAGAAITVTDANGEEIEPLPYTITKTFDGTTVTVPKAALDIICSVGAERLNGILLIKDPKMELETDTTFERFMGEFLVWGFTQYFPALVGILDPTTQDSYIADASGELRTWTNAVDKFINSVYSDYSSRTVSETANWDAIYTLIDATLFTLLPESYLPNLNGSFELLNGLILGNLINFDLQGILTVFSVNTDANAELAQPLMTVLLRIIDRVLAAVFNDRGVMIPANRTGVVTNNNITNITTLEGLLACGSNDASLPTFIYNLLSYLQKYGLPDSNGVTEASLLAVALPLIVSSVYEKPADSMLTNNGITTYKVDDLEDYVNYFNSNVNAVVYLEDLDADTAEMLTDGTATVVRSTDGTCYELKLSDGTVWATFDDYTAANTERKTLNHCYIVKEVVDEKTETYTYDLYSKKSYLTTATATESTDDAGVTTIYSDFRYASMTDRTASYPFVSYDGDYRFFEFEDFTNGCSYENAQSALDDASDYVSSYKNFATNDLADAYAAWLMYSVEARLKVADLYDKNDDGYSVLSESDSDYVAATDSSDGVPVDGYPSVPTAMLPYSTSSTTAFTYYDDATGSNITVYMGGDNDNSMTAAKFEQIQLALDYAADSDNDVALTTIETEKVVRLALGTLAFDITPHEDGTYNTGAAQWETLTSDQISTISTWCANNGFSLAYETAEDGTEGYVIRHKAFALISSLTTLSGVSITPVSLSEFQTLNNNKERTEEQDLQLQIYKSYSNYCENLYKNRRSLYNKMDYVSYRRELAEDDRARRLEVTMLDWVLDLTNGAYINATTNKRNYKLGTGVDASTGLPIEVKVYTSSSYENFRKAYEYGQALVNASQAATLATGYTQAQVTEAFYGIMDAYNELIEYLGAADKTQLIAYIQIADAILADEYTYDATYGVEEAGLTNLTNILAEAKTMRDDDSYDADSQGEVDTMAATLNQAISLLVYKTAPTILPSDTTTGNGNIVSVIQTSNINNRIVGQVYGLEEGVGAVMDLIELVGMTVDSSVGNTVTITPAGRGMGTGSYYSGRVGGNEKFRYYAVVYGDLNGDTRVDGTDASYLEYYMAIESANSSDMGSAVYEAADANHDGMVDAGDVSTIVNHYTFKEEINQLSHSTSETTI